MTMTPTPPQAGERAEASALTRAREYLRGIDTDGYRYDHPITILAALVAEIEGAPEAGLCIFNNAIRFREATNTTAIIAMVGKRVRLLALDSGGAGEVG